MCVLDVEPPGKHQTSYRYKYIPYVSVRPRRALPPLPRASTLPTIDYRLSSPFLKVKLPYRCDLLLLQMGLLLRRAQLRVSDGETHGNLYSVVNYVQCYNSCST